jgi:hypothetical protein
VKSKRQKNQRNVRLFMYYLCMCLCVCACVRVGLALSAVSGMHTPALAAKQIREERERKKK